MSTTNDYMTDRSAPLPQPMSFRVKPSTKAALEKAAEDDSRSVSSLIEKILVEWLKRRSYLPK